MNNILYIDAFNFIKTNYLEQNESDIKEIAEVESKGTFYFNNYYKKRVKPWFYEQNLTRKAIVMINRLRSNHTSLISSLRKLNIVEDDLCVCGLSIEKADHITWECNKFKKKRGKMIKELKLYKITYSTLITKILVDMKADVIQIITDFINEIGIVV